MATVEGLKNQVATKQQGVVQTKGPKATLNDTLIRMQPEIQRALPSNMNAERFARIAMTAVSTTPKLLECDQTSFLAALMQSAQLGVEPNTGLGQAYLIPYGNKVQFQLSYKGLIELATRSGQYKAIYAHEVYAEDEFSYSYGLNKDLIHVPSQNPKGDPIGYYAVYHLKNGGYDFVYWTKERVDKHAKKFSIPVQKGYQSPWNSNYDAMAKKTVLKEVLKYAPKSIELEKTVAADETVKEHLSNDMSIIEATHYEINEETGEIMS